MRNTTPTPPSVTAGTLCLTAVAAVLGLLQWADLIHVLHGAYEALTVLAIIIGGCGWIGWRINGLAKQRDAELRAELRHYAGVIEMMARDMTAADVRHHAEVTRLVELLKRAERRPCAPDPRSAGNVYIGRVARQDATATLPAAGKLDREQYWRVYTDVLEDLSGGSSEPPSEQ